MNLDLEQIKAAARAAGGGQWTASDGIVWFDDGDSALTVMNPVPAHIAHDNLGTWPDPIAAEDIAKFSALVCPAAVLALVERLERADAALEVALRFGGIDGEHHKTWVIDQMCRALLGDGYEDFVVAAKAGEDGPESYAWDVGIAP